MGFCLLSMLLFFCACADKKTIFEIKNQSQYTLEDLQIAPTCDTTERTKIAPKTGIKVTIDSRCLGKTDGSYKLSFKAGNIGRAAVFGYFTNGNAVPGQTLIEVSNDTILIKEAKR